MPCFKPALSFKFQDIARYRFSVLRMEAPYLLVEAYFLSSQEDFQTMIYGFKLATDVTDLRVIGMLKEVEEEVTRKVKGTRVRSGEKRSPEVEQEHELAVALQARIKFFRVFIMALLAFSKKELKAGVEEAKKLIHQALDLLPVIRNSIQLGIEPETQTRENTHPKAPDFPLLMGFEPLVNQRLLPPTFPRYAKIVGRDQAVDYFDALLKRLLSVCDVIHIVGFHFIIDFVSQFSRKCPCVLSRSILQLVILPHNNRKVFGVELVQDILRDAVRSFVLPPAVAARSPLYNNPAVKEMVDALLLHGVRPMSNFLQTFGHNRARQRDKLSQLLEEMANLQDEAEKVDANLHGLMVISEPRRPYKACFGSWVMYHTLRAMMAYILLGFELELYAVHEYHYIYWYLADFLLAWYISTLTRADNMLQEHEAAYMDIPGKGRSNKKKIKKKKVRPLEVELLLSQGLQTLCLGFYKAANGFMLEGKIQRPAREFDSEHVRFEHRFAAFNCIITPPLVQYDQYYQICDLKLFENQPNRATDIYFTAHNLFMKALVIFEKITNSSSED
ncbi:putative N-alpha-acetyltransferase 35, NatC auxiliary subunit [Apostichopus japonicus]|uniref:Protein MAK10 homolog n=1 Tax=Stichopus japonicus TaxID=307972 RepID=A0A2G8K168_STIJA|nr:putative N-alpha-acetyltransferase 35, NatC auxiliary subunit [Apostichopus japonicus]